MELTDRSFKIDQKKASWLTYSLAFAGLAINIAYFSAELLSGIDFFSHYWDHFFEHAIILSLVVIFPWMAYLLNRLIYTKESGERSQFLEHEMEERTQELEDFKSFSENIMASVNDMVFAIGSDGRFQFVTGNSNMVLGYDPEKLVGLQFVDLIAEGSVAIAVGNFERIMWGDQVPRYDLEMTDPTGKTRAVEINSAPYRNDERVIAQVGVAREVNERKQLQLHIKQREREMLALNAVASAAGKALDQKHILNNALEQIITLLCADRAWISIFDRQCDELTLHSWKGAGADSEMIRRAFTCRLGEGFAGMVAVEGAPRTVNVEDLADEISLPLKQMDTESLAAIPMLAGGKLVGVLCVASADPDHFHQPGMDLLEVISCQIAMTIENARLSGAFQFSGPAKVSNA